MEINWGRAYEGALADGRIQHPLFQRLEAVQSGEQGGPRPEQRVVVAFAAGVAHGRQQGAQEQTQPGDALPQRTACRVEQRAQQGPQEARTFSQRVADQAQHRVTEKVCLEMDAAGVEGRNPPAGGANLWQDGAACTRVYIALP